MKGMRAWAQLAGACTTVEHDTTTRNESNRLFTIADVPELQIQATETYQGMDLPA